MTGKEKAMLHRDLVEILTSCKDDNAYYERLLYSLQIILNELTYFNKVERDDEE